jgi:hypothetical protein
MKVHWLQRPRSKRLPTTDEPEPNGDKSSQVAPPENEDQIKFVLALAQTSPKLALISLAIEIEKELREIIFSQGPAGESYRFSFPLALKLLETRGILPSHTIMALRDFQNVRNQIVHGRGAVSSDDIARTSRRENASPGNGAISILGASLGIVIQILMRLSTRGQDQWNLLDGTSKILKVNKLKRTQPRKRLFPRPRRSPLMIVC